LMKDVARAFEEARHDPNLVVIEGFHAWKHAIRFGAEIELAVVCDRGELTRLAESLAPDVCQVMAEAAELVTATQFRALSAHPPRTNVMAIAKKPTFSAAKVIAKDDGRPVVLLEEPHNLGNVGASIRVAAAAGAGAVVTTGTVDPWGAAAVRGSAGLHFAIAVGTVGADFASERIIVAADPEGESIDHASLPGGAILAFGTEREGLSDRLLARADRRVRIPMRAGVSSLNLATSVAVFLYRRG